MAHSTNKELTFFYSIVLVLSLGIFFFSALSKHISDNLHLFMVVFKPLVVVHRMTTTLKIIRKQNRIYCNKIHTFGILIIQFIKTYVKQHIFLKFWQIFRDYAMSRHTSTEATFCFCIYFNKLKDNNKIIWFSCVCIAVGCRHKYGYENYIKLNEKGCYLKFFVLFYPKEHVSSFLNYFVYCLCFSLSWILLN